MGKYVLLGLSLILFFVAVLGKIKAGNTSPAHSPESESVIQEKTISRHELFYRMLDSVFPVSKRSEYHNEGFQGVKIPVLCYHRIDSGKSDAYYIAEENFRWQMEYLAKNCTVIPTSELIAYIRYMQGLASVPVTLPENPVVIHFDDNYRSVYTHAYPVLKHLNLPWTFYVYKHHHIPNSREHLGEMALNGVDFQSHSMTHPWFHKPADNQSLTQYIQEMHWQVEGSKKYIEEISGRPVTSLAYPFGTHSDLAVALCFRYGYEAMFGADGGYASAESSLAAIERILVTKGWSQELFKKTVHGQMRYKRSYTPSKLIASPVDLERLAGLDNYSNGK